MTLCNGEELPSPFLLFDLEMCRIRKVERYKPGHWTIYLWTSGGWQYHDDIGELSATMLYQSYEQLFVGVE
jgi:hypothetical protein